MKRAVPVRLWQCTCDKCGRGWRSRTEEMPRICPFCKSKLWDSEGIRNRNPKAADQRRPA